METLSTTRLSIILTIFVFRQTSCLSVIPEYYLDEDAVAYSACGEVIKDQSSVYFRSHVGAGLFGGLNSYHPNQDCETTFEVDTGSHILVQYFYFDLQDPSGETCIDKIQLKENIVKAQDAMNQASYINVTKENVTEVCNGTDDNPTCFNVTSNYTVLVLDNGPQSGDTFEEQTTVVCKNPESYDSSTNRLKIRFQSDGSVQGSGVTLMVTAYREAPCDDKIEFLCDTNRCISKTLTCDGVNHCLDKTDEAKEHADCSSIDVLVGKISGLGKHVFIGIVIIVAGIICTIVIVVMLSQFMGKGSQSSCIRGNSSAADDDEESQTPRNIRTRRQDNDIKPSRQKKSVTIVASHSKNIPDRGNKRARKVAPAESFEDEW